MAKRITIKRPNRTSTSQTIYCGNAWKIAFWTKRIAITVIFFCMFISLGYFFYNGVKEIREMTKEITEAQDIFKPGDKVTIKVSGETATVTDVIFDWVYVNVYRPDSNTPYQTAKFHMNELINKTKTNTLGSNYD